MRTLSLAVVLATFSLLSGFVVVQHGYFGFVMLALKEPWGLQMLLDLCIALWLGWAAVDRLELEGPPTWPYKLATPALGSIALLGYLLHCAVARRSRSVSAHASVTGQNHEASMPNNVNPLTLRK